MMVGSKSRKPGKYQATRWGKHGTALPAETERAVLRRLPGKARPRAEALQEYEDYNSRRRRNLPPPLWPLLAPDPAAFYRWRVQLRCRCITEVLTGGPESAPDQQCWPDRACGVRLPAGQLVCVHDGAPEPPYQAVVDWGHRRAVSFPADPADPPAWADEETWAVLRWNEPHTSAFWTVTLACGHATEAVTDLDWRPADGPHRVSPQRQREMVADFAEFWAAHPDARSARHREHAQRMLEDGWPRPQPEYLCYTCPNAQPILAYQRIGRLTAAIPAPTTPPPLPRTELERQLRRAEADARRIRRQLADTED